MKVAIFEVCRTPEIKKKTEAVILTNFFSKHNIEYELYSNDYIWENTTIIDKNFIELSLQKSDASIVHLALHGNDNSLILKWCNKEQIIKRIPEDILSNIDIKLMNGWRDKLIVSGACYSAQLADSFLEAGAMAVIAPKTAIPWTNLGKFFSIFYKSFLLDQNLIVALDLAKAHFPEFNSYYLYSPN
ncbi:MAG TPA: hypothetical protein DEG17_21300 [Cyanobacteria bacterium UBA11149]|nr:hypothetical protein [Cyanobacteria bacterium UBA11367]HBE55943.1 hypothetical protein [Cyanobacteria bacterium UBA11366]HBK63660.1 hypothetical protein [Cyanobacteria bacterium UBA11166]HBR77158.1 hypothetical protein [Cyanobacteria bacterium UBA11159]HBS68649.1 hypothetical protein [Cyanobacteria bacterium UBA11153]HBW91325.1 hypothetical protein [Cyanobacteria bacterium UBA11149]HCA93635.1 hypothetical protein [Cyanobacteria bacterium UBA9226]